MSNRHPLRPVWNAMKARCNNPSHKAWKYYGGRGIGVCPEWLDFQAFFAWAMTSGYRVGLTIERKDNNAGYNPTNCIWTTQKEQNQNRQNTILVDVEGETVPACVIAVQHGLSPRTVLKRARRGVSPDKWFEPSKRDNRKYPIPDNRNGLNISVIISRIKRGWPEDRWLEPTRAYVRR